MLDEMGCKLRIALNLEDSQSPVRLLHYKHQSIVNIAWNRMLVKSYFVVWYNDLISYPTPRTAWPSPRPRALCFRAERPFSYETTGV